ncbi:MAG TPA: Gfo/Idh/MocA family oxidoreductase [Stellaceae bacterium]|nr:Gfo/Idh/MocA family oxidoreductase [Stellaceae bacterium]
MQRFAYIGTGWWGMELAKNSLALKDMIEIAGCCTLVDKEAASFQAQFGGKRFPRYEDALADPAVDAVLLATPHSLHAQQIIAAAKAKKNVFVEKPMTLTVESGREAAKACEEAHVALGIGHNRRYSQVARKMKAMVESGEVGKVLHVEANYSSAGGMHYVPGMWRAKREECPGGGLAPMSLHVIDTLTWILGPIKRLSGIAKRQAITQVELDDTAAALFELESGATGSLGCVFATAMNATLKLYGTKASIEARDNFKELLVTPVGATEPKVHWRYEIDDTVQQELKAFAEACANKTKFPVRPAEALHNVAVMQAIMESSDKGSAWVTLPARG